MFVTFFCLPFTLIIPTKVTGFCMKQPHKHGVDQVNLNIPPGGWRAVVLFRWLQPLIKLQAESHRDNCNNDDKNLEMWKKCKCHKIKLN